MNDVREDILAPDADGHAVFCGLAFDGCYIYATLPMGCKVRRFSPELRPRGVYKTTRPYRAIAYDTRGKFFWASSDGDIDKLYKLDRKLQEVDRLTLKIDKSDICSPIVSLSYDCERDKILVAYKDAVMEADKAGEVRVLRRQSMPRAEAVLAAAPYYAVALKGDSDTEIVITEMEGRHVFTLPVPDGYTVQDMALQPCSRDKDDTPDGVRHERHGTAQILVLVQKHGGYPAILRYKADCVKLACCNYDVCREKCGKHNDDDDGEQCENDLLCSIALVETALSHILNAEGEKLQRAVEVAENTEELLAVNKSVTKVIIGAAQLEFMLYLKLDALRSLREKTQPRQQ